MANFSEDGSLVLRIAFCFKGQLRLCCCNLYIGEGSPGDQLPCRCSPLKHIPERSPVAPWEGIHMLEIVLELVAEQKDHKWLETGR